jgi:dUTP pyrophosphatase
MIFKEKAKVYRIRDTAKIPVRAHDGDAGIDFFFAPSDNEPAVIEPGHSAILATGIKIEVPSWQMLQIMNKSSVASKRSVITGACVVDYGYNGEIFINLHNIGMTTQTFVPGSKLAQGVFIKISRPDLIDWPDDNIYGVPTDRGEGGFGSTGDK